VVRGLAAIAVAFKQPDIGKTFLEMPLGEGAPQVLEVFNSA
jgi:hypothetical protein